MGCVGIDEEGEIFLARQVLWNLTGMGDMMAEGDKRLGSKTTTLEFAGILIPFLSELESLSGQHVKIQVDNIGCCFAWENGYGKDDRLVSVLVRTLLLISARLSSVVHICHHPRESSWESCMADRLSRSRTTSGHEMGILRRFQYRNLPHAFTQWMENPREDWALPWNVVDQLF